MVDLRDVGLSSYEERAYRGLLELGTATAKEVAASTEVPQGRIYDVLDSLESRGVVRVQTASRPQKYIAVEPEIAVSRVVEARTRELESEIKRYEVLEDQLVESLSTEQTVQGRFWTTAIGADSAVELLFERIDAATEQVVLVADIGTRALDITDVASDGLDHLSRALDRGVEVSLLVSEAVFDRAPPRLIERVSREPFDEPGFTIRTTDELLGGYYLIDHDELCFGVTNPFVREIIGMVNLKDPRLAAEMEAQFLEHWQHSEPFERQS